MAIVVSQRYEKNNSQAYVYVCGQRFDTARYYDAAQEIALQLALKDARRRFGHALCACKKPYLKLQIRKLDQKYYLAVWPEGGILHDSSCMFFREERVERKTDHQTRTVVPVDTSSQSSIGGAETAFNIALAFSFGVYADGSQAQRSPDTANSKELTVQERLKPAPTMNIRGLSNVLWEESSLTRWHPKWSRDWGRARYELIAAAKRLFVKGVPLSDHLYVPAPYRAERQNVLNAELDRFTRRLANNQGEMIRSGLIVAPVRKLVRMDAQFESVHLRNMVPPVGLSRGTIEYLRSECSDACQRLEQISSENSKGAGLGYGVGQETRASEVIAFMHVRVGTKGGLWCLGAWFMMTHPKIFIPTASLYEELLVQAMIDDGYQFSRYLSTEATVKRGQFDWLVRHVSDPAGVPVARAAIDIIRPEKNDDYRRRRLALGRRVANKGIPVWTWSPIDGKAYSEAPPLPPIDDWADVARKERSKAMLNATDVTYSYPTSDLTAKAADQPNREGSGK